MPSTSFRFGPDAEHEVTVQCGYFGREKYFVDGALVLSHWSFWPSGTRGFAARGHTIQIRLSVGLNAARAEAFVDGELVADDLFAEFNAMVARHGTNFDVPAKVAFWLVVAVAAFAGFRLLTSSNVGQ